MEHAHITLPDFPGGSEIFEAAVKYCYAVKIERTPLKIAPLRCAGEVLEMTNEYWILAHFLHRVEQITTTADLIDDEDAGDEQSCNRVVELMLVGKLIDGYLSKIASDTNLKPKKFLELAFELPKQARVYDDGLYRVVDVYLKV
ncbi:putative NPH3 domain-containing protein [Helianthus anomalus]